MAYLAVQMAHKLACIRTLTCSLQMATSCL